MLPLVTMMSFTTKVVDCETMGSDIILKTDQSYLVSRSFNQAVLVEQCVAEVTELLDITPEIVVYGKIVHQRRDVGFFSDDSVGYFYSGKLSPSKPMTPGLIELLYWINNEFNSAFNGILINRYNSGNDYISAHGDDERHLDPVGVVAISFGASRIFRIRDKKNKEIVANIWTDNDHILHMGGQFQQEFTHEIPVQKKILEPRYSFTFRKHTN